MNSKRATPNLLKLEDNIRLIKMMSILLVALMVIRHSMFYFGVGSIQTEMGSKQSFLGVMLIPVTASFGIFLFYCRNSLQYNVRNLFKFILIGSIPIVLAIGNNDGLLSVFSYSINDASRRPSFLVLLPISIAALISFFKRYDKYTFFVIAIVYFFSSDNFICHYVFIFNLFRITNLFYFSNFSNRGFFIAVYFLILIGLTNFEIDRINIIHEFIFSVAYLISIAAISYHILRVLKILRMPSPVLGVPVLYFYVIQGVFFTIMSAWISKDASAEIKMIGTFFVFILSFFLSRKIASLYKI